ncbi:MAG: hypothetical protein ABSA65_20305 [Acidimicrobiales bacterium]
MTDGSGGKRLCTGLDGHVGIGDHVVLPARVPGSPASRGEDDMALAVGQGRKWRDTRLAGLDANSGNEEQLDVGKVTPD